MLKPKVVSIGGGTGQAALLRGLKKYDLDLTAIVTVLDSGRSTGLIRKKFNIAAPGDIRNCIIALSESEEDFNKIFLHRFKNHFEGMNVGNLVFAALTEITGSFDDAIDEFSKLFKIKGKVYPSTLENTNIAGELINGQTVKTEHEITNRNTPGIKKIFLEKPVKAYKKAVKAIKEADYIIVGPGGLYTSVLANFLIEEIRKAYIESKAKKILIPNLATQPGVTDHLDFLKHVEEINKYVSNQKNSFNYIILNNKRPDKKILIRYEKENAKYLQPKKEELQKIEREGTTIIKEDLIQKYAKKEYGKPLYMRHDSNKLAETIINIITPEKPIIGLILAAGSGSRMKPFSLSTPKVMLKFLGKPLLAHHVDEMLKNNIKEFIIICNEENKDEIKKYFDKNYSEIKINYTTQKEQLGPAHAILSAEKHLKRSYFLLKYGDSISKEDQIKGILETFNKDKKVKAVMTLRDVDDPSEYGVARFEDGKLVEIVEKPKENTPSKLANVGLALIDSDSFFKSIKKHGYKNVLPPPQYLLLEKQPVSYWISMSERVDVGRAHNILSANKLLIDKFGGKNESNQISRTAKISKKSYIDKNAVIEENTTIGDYASIEGYVGRNCKIEKSVIMEGTKIGDKSIISCSVIGKNNYIEGNFRTKTGKEKIYVKDKYVEPDTEVGLFSGDNVVIKKNTESSPGKMIFPNKIINQNIIKDKLVRVIVFDADNTIYQTKNVAKQSDMAAMKYFSKITKVKPEKLYEDWKKIVNAIKNEKEPSKRHRKYSYTKLLEQKRIKNPAMNAGKGFSEFLKILQKEIKLVPGFMNALKHLHKYDLAICTEDNKDLALAKITQLGLSKYFPIIICAEDAGEMKPSKKYYEELFKKISRSPNECLFIGDNYEKDLSIPKTMGATTVLFSEQKNKNSDYSVKNYNKFLELLKEI